VVALGVLTAVCYIAVRQCHDVQAHEPHLHGEIKLTRPDVPTTYGQLGPIPRNPAYLIEASHGAVATENVVCSRTGVDVLKDGGNAVDAAIAASLCIGTQNMFSCVCHMIRIS
jgi:hypothetical protein